MSLPPLVTSPSHWLLGPAFYVQRAPLEWIPRWSRELGDIFRLKSPLGQAAVITSPELARQVLADRYSR